MPVFPAIEIKAETGKVKVDGGVVEADTGVVEADGGAVEADGGAVEVDVTIKIERGSTLMGTHLFPMLNREII